MAPKIVDKEMKRLEIAATAGILFGKRGFDKVTIDDVAKAAGIGKGTIYEYFKNKDELIHGAFTTLMGHMSQELQNSIDLTLTPLDALKKATFDMVDALDHFGEQYGFFLEYMLLLNRGETDGSPLINMAGEYRCMIAGLLEAAIDAEQIRPDISINDTAAAYCAWFDGAVFHWMLMPEPTLKELGQGFWNFFAQGIVLQKEAPTKAPQGALHEE